MRFKLLGQSGLRVSELCYGTMTFGQGRGTWGATKEDSRNSFRCFVDAGGNFFDTANSYQAGDSEVFLAEFMGARRHDYVVATKFTMGGRPNDPNSWGNHRKSMIQAVEGSLRRLNTDYIDLYWMHAWDQLTPQEEVLRALDDLVRSGKVLYIGLSDTPAWVVSRSQAIAELRGWSTLAAIQMPYSLVERTPERELLPMATSLGMSILSWGGLAAGMLSGKYKSAAQAGEVNGRLTSTDQSRTKVLSDRNFSIVAAVESIAAGIGAKPSQVALAWVRTRSPAIIPVLGARTAAQLAENLGCLDLQLDSEQLEQLENVSAIEHGFPTDFLGSDMIQSMLYQNMRPQIDAPIRVPKV
ncbi:aldo/keto reductase [Noviherbaspirillum sedimenti]|uniref:Aldo/keto reductase n=1 Tax=Noviherbaspirillum sedimenti TaxID=2320865 RepID=A0A3A3G3N1_9BURK|nr:aldo/keto reductase [Noviherbaspirillum sedimenti]RJG03103.1 aldo/keto reductase [Noviherbaspirillum sedimenti]